MLALPLGGKDRNTGAYLPEYPLRVSFSCQKQKYQIQGLIAPSNHPPL